MGMRTRQAARPVAPVVVVLLALLGLPAGAPQPATPAEGMRITELLPAPDGAVGQREFIEIHNVGPSTIPLEGWRIEDAATASGAVNGFTFGDEAVGAGQRIVVWSNGSADARGPAWSSSPSKTVWNDAGDAAALLDPAGRVVDWFAYGNSAVPPPAGFANASQPEAPPRGASLSLGDEGWVAGPPSPGLAPGTQGGVADAEVQNVAPHAALTAPTSAKPAEPIHVGLQVDDGNGQGDIVAWSLRGGSSVLASGNATPPAAVDVRAPSASGPWALEFEVRDRSGAVARANATVQVRDANVALTLPTSGGLRFPALVPGQRNATSLEPFVLHNDGTDPLPLLIDVSPFSASGATIPVDGNLWVGFAVGNATDAAGAQWSRYERPLQPLPPLAPGESYAVWLRIDAVPAPLAAGAYGTSFTVVPA